MQTPPPTQEVEIPRPKPTLRESLRGLDLDILQELEAFRSWQHHHLPASTPSLIEDLDEEIAQDRFGWVSHTLLLFSVWLASCAGLILGIWWLFTPGSPNQVRRPPQIEPIDLIRVDLANLPLVPPVELDTLPIIPWIDLATLPLLPEVDLDLLLAQATPLPSPTPAPTQAPTPPSPPCRSPGGFSPSPSPGSSCGFTQPKRRNLHCGGHL